MQVEISCDLRWFLKINPRLLCIVSVSPNSASQFTARIRYRDWLLNCLFSIFRWWCSSFYILWSHSFARASSHVADFNTCNKLLTQKLLKQGYRYHKLRKTFYKFYRRYYYLFPKCRSEIAASLKETRNELGCLIMRWSSKNNYFCWKSHPFTMSRKQLITVWHQGIYCLC